MNAEFTLTVVTSRDGYIARHPGEPPQAWASAEEQRLFSGDIKAADWCVMGRHTHEAADRRDRRRVVFSTTRSGWARPSQLWLDPRSTSPGELPALVAQVHPLRRGLVLGGTRVHDWFLQHRAIARVHLTVEPVSFGGGLPVFSRQFHRDPVEAFRAAGFSVLQERQLNETGTRYLLMQPDPAHGAGQEGACRSKP